MFHHFRELWYISFYISCWISRTGLTPSTGGFRLWSFPSTSSAPRGVIPSWRRNWGLFWSMRISRLGYFRWRRLSGNIILSRCLGSCFSKRRPSKCGRSRVVGILVLSCLDSSLRTWIKRPTPCGPFALPVLLRLSYVVLRCNEEKAELLCGAQVMCGDKSRERDNFSQVFVEDDPFFVMTLWVNPFPKL